MTKGILDQYTRSYDEELAFSEEEAVAQAAIVIAHILERDGVSQRELARRLKISEGRISQILSAEANLTVKTLARIGRALGYRLQLDFVVGHSAHEESVSEPERDVPDKEPWPEKVIHIASWRHRGEDPTSEEMDAPYAAA